MDAPGDISDEFDDEALRSSIERADQQGQWRDGAGGFVDPKLETIKKQLTEPERASYAQRRLRDLQEQAAAKAAADAAAAAAAEAAAAAGASAANTPDTPDPFAGDWRQTVVAPLEAEAPSGEVTVTAEPSYVVSSQSVHPVLTPLRPLFTGLWVFAPIAVVQGLLAGWSYDLPLRAIVAAALAGFLWDRLDVERFRAAVVGTGVHVLVFFVTAAAWDAFALIGNSAGFLIALIGSLVAGSMRESRKMLADHGR